jgi:hypothetical protein
MQPSETRAVAFSVPLAFFQVTFPEKLDEKTAKARSSETNSLCCDFMQGR